VHTRERDVFYWQERTLLKNLDTEWIEHVLFKIVDKDNIEGIGAATPDIYFGQTFKSTMAILEELREFIENVPDIENVLTVAKLMDKLIQDENTAKTSIMLTICDYINNKYKLDVSKLLFSFEKDKYQDNIYRIFWRKNINVLEVYNSHLKNDEVVKLEFLEKPSISDLEELSSAFQGKQVWLDFRGLLDFYELTKALDIMNQLKIVALEQPLAKGREKKVELIESQYPIFWDESIVTLEDLLRLHDFSNGIVLSLTKVGGLFNVKKIYDLAEIYNLITVISTGIEHPININWSNKIKASFDIVDLSFDYYLIEKNFE
jgi:L-alanine-DL-glutamate epimerase-like enolase superfamily enzyme